MDRARYIELLTQDGNALVAAAARDLDAAVPPCPGWTVRDAVLHTADVYVDKRVTIELGGEEPEWPPKRSNDVDPLAYFREEHERLLSTFATMDDDAPAATWWPSERKAGLWIRRMAQETAVHRADVESAFGAITPVDDELAVDGVDEVLVLFLGGPWWDEERWRTVTGTANVTTGGRTWHVVMGPDDVTVTESDEPADVTVTGDPSPTLLWLWGRAPDTAVQITGDPTNLRQRLTVTQ